MFSSVQNDPLEGYVETFDLQQCQKQSCAAHFRSVQVPFSVRVPKPPCQNEEPTGLSAVHSLTIMLTFASQKYHSSMSLSMLSDVGARSKHESTESQHVISQYALLVEVSPTSL